jgi:acyl-CoA synthetase (AMP-forming)/AMP-acid ligase II
LADCARGIRIGLEYDRLQVRLDAEGYFWFDGRAEQIIVRGGSNISPQEVEEALYHHSATGAVIPIALWLLFGAALQNRT